MTTSSASKPITRATSIKTNFIEKLADILNDKNLTEIDYETEDMRIHIVRNLPPEGAAIAAKLPYIQAQENQKSEESTQAVSTPQDSKMHVKAPMVGIAYLSAEPGTTPFIKKGDKIDKGQTLLLIEAMKTFNPVRSPIDGTIASILVSDGQPIEFDQSLIIIE